MESIENEIEPGHHIGQRRVSFTESTSTQYRNLLAFLNLLEIQIMNRHPHHFKTASTRANNMPR
jgi:hypothetical protein